MEVQKIHQQIISMAERVHQSRSNTSFPEALKSLLHTSRSVTFDRISGKKNLSFEEALKIIEAFGISMDSLIYPDNTQMRMAALNSTTLSYETYLQGICADLRKLHSLPSCEVTYLASEVPLFHYLHVPLLAAFKLYIWSHTIWTSENRKPFDADAFLKDRTLMGLIQEARDLYAQLKTQEVWPSSLFSNPIHQIQYCHKAGLFKNPDIASRLVNALYEQRDYLQKVARTGYKHTADGKRAAPQQTHHCDLISTNTIIHINGGPFQMTYNIFDTPNFMTSTSEAMNKHTRDLIQKKKSFGTDISTNEVAQHDFFRNINVAIQAAANEVKYIDEVVQVG